MNRIFLLCVVILTGCAQAPRAPTSVMIMPNDCANRVAIIKWLEDVAATPRSTFESQEQYEQNRSLVKDRIWRLRYNCQRV